MYDELQPPAGEDLRIGMKPGPVHNRAPRAFSSWDLLKESPDAIYEPTLAIRDRARYRYRASSLREPLSRLIARTESDSELIRSPSLDRVALPVVISSYLRISLHPVAYYERAILFLRISDLEAISSTWKQYRLAVSLSLFLSPAGIFIFRCPQVDSNRSNAPGGTYAMETCTRDVAHRRVRGTFPRAETACGRTAGGGEGRGREARSSGNVREKFQYASKFWRPCTECI